MSDADTLHRKTILLIGTLLIALYFIFVAWEDWGYSSSFLFDLVNAARGVVSAIKFFVVMYAVVFLLYFLQRYLGWLSLVLAAGYMLLTFYAAHLTHNPFINIFQDTEEFLPIIYAILVMGLSILYIRSERGRSYLMRGSIVGLLVTGALLYGMVIPYYLASIVVPFGYPSDGEWWLGWVIAGNMLLFLLPAGAVIGMLLEWWLHRIALVATADSNAKNQ